MNSRSLAYVLGVISGIAAVTAWPFLSRPTMLASAQTPVAQAKIPAKVKEDPAFKAEWEKLRNSDPKAFEKQKDQFTVMAQMNLAEFGYGTSFTADLDAQTKEALKAYQIHRGLPATADIDPLTIDQLRADDELIHQSELFLAPFQFFADGWDQGGFAANGSWLEDGAVDPEIESGQVECYRDWKLCIDGQARQLKGFGGGINLVGKFEAYQIKSWDKYEIVADSAYPSPCERDTLRINRQEKSVTIVSTPAYQNAKTCQDLLGKPKTVDIHLVDGNKISGPLNQKKQDALHFLLKFSDKARALMNSPSGR
jgi:Putative peptidoglycan binding domain